MQPDQISCVQKQLFDLCGLQHSMMHVLAVLITSLPQRLVGC